MWGTGDSQGTPGPQCSGELLSSCSEDRSLGVASTVATDLLAHCLTGKLYSILNAVIHFYLFFTCFHFFSPLPLFPGVGGCLVWAVAAL